MEYFEIKIDNCRFYAYHGVMDHERKAGNEYQLSITVKYPAVSPEKDDLDNSISYADLYDIAKIEMATPRLLLETVASSIGRKISSRWTQHLGIEVKITKVTPPISGFDGSATVVYHRDLEPVVEKI